MARTSQLQLWSRPFPKLVLAGIVMYALYPLLKKKAPQIEGVTNMLKQKLQLTEEVRETV